MLLQDKVELKQLPMNIVIDKLSEFYFNNELDLITELKHQLILGLPVLVL